jgi:hypothetical protein
MKKRTLSLILFAAALLALFWWLRAPTTGTRKPVVTPTPAAEPKRAAENTTASDTSKPANKLEFLRDLARQSNRPIRFYGKVIDQDNNPIPDVKVKLAIRTAKEPISGVVGDVFEYPVVSTDSSGRFSITDAKGALLSVKSLEKEGYEASQKSLNRAHYWYWRDPSEVFTPDPDAPEIFRMWRKQGAEKLAVHDRMTRIPYNGTPVVFDLLTGRQNVRGDLRVTLLRNPEQIQWGQRNYEWTLTVEAIDGGVIESNDEQMFLAPEEGYMPKVVFHMPANAPDWSDEKSLTLYVKSRGGKQYGRVELSVMVGSDKPTTGFSFRSAVNPSGSRNLEYDPTQDTTRDPPSRSAATSRPATPEAGATPPNP